MRKGNSGVSAVVANSPVMYRFAARLMAAVLVLAFGTAANARADFGLESFSARVSDVNGADETRAGIHPYSATVAFRLNSYTDNGATLPQGSMKDVIVDLPAGFVGKPQAVPYCPRVNVPDSTCSPSTQVGVVTLVTTAFGFTSTGTTGVYNVRPVKGSIADFAFQVSGVPVHVSVSLRSDGDYGVRTTISNISQALPVTATRLTLWGVPADPSHDVLRDSNYYCLADQDAPECLDPTNNPGFAIGGGRSANVAPEPLLANPTLCGPVLETKIKVDSWEQPGVWSSATSTTSSGPTRCNQLTFSPEIMLVPTTTRAETSSGLNVELTLPQNDSLRGTITPSLRRAVVVLPEGLTINPSAADGLLGCSDVQVGIGTMNPVSCPEASKIGQVSIVSPLLAEPLDGSIFIGRPVMGKPYRIFVIADNENYGISVRLEGLLQPDPVTGRLTTVFEGNPQLPFSRLTLTFKSGPRAPLATPQTCGVANTGAQLTPWADPNAPGVPIGDSVTISWDGNGAPCPAPGFAPSYRAGGTTPKAGADTKFSLTFGRDDRERYLRDTAVTLPRGLLARIGSVPLCPESVAAAGTCAAGSQIGTTTVGAGAGSSPFFLGGRVFITGPYKGAPYGMSIVVPAKAGPFDLGTVVVRAAIFVDRTTAQLRVVSDELPHILEGIPLRLRRVNVTIDRDKFMVNPTNCGASNISASIGSIGGAAAGVLSPFQIVNCRGLPFRPKLTIRAGARGKLTRGKRTPLEVTLAMPSGQANNRSVRVTLPLSLNARLDVVNKRRACTEAQFQADRCPMQVGEAVAVTPLLRDPLKGPAYFVYTPARRLPDLVVRLRGPIAIDLVGKVTIAKDLRLQTTFDAVPDAPITKFRLSLASGSTNGPIGVVRNLCSATTRRGLKAGLAYVAQSGETLSKQQQISVVGCGRAARRSMRRASR